MSDSASSTSLTLLGAVQGGSEAAWSDFLRRYRPLILRWCFQQGLQLADAEEVASEVLLRMARSLPSFHYDPAKRFRSWLRTVVRNALSDYLTSQARRPGAVGTGDSAAAVALNEITAHDRSESLVQTIDESMNRDMKLAGEVARRVRERVEEQTWQAYWLTACEGRSGPEAAARLKIPVANVYVAKGRVAKLLKVIKETVSIETPMES